MPPVIVAVAAAAAGYAATAGAVALGIGVVATGSVLGGVTLTAGLGATLIGAVAATAVAFVGNTIIGKPKSPSSPLSNIDTTGRSVNVRQSIAKQRLIVGQQKVAGVTVFVATSDDDTARNNLLHMVVAVAGHEVDSIGEVWFDDQHVPMTAITISGQTGYTPASGPFAGVRSASGTQWVVIQKFTGTATQAASNLLMAHCPEWTSAHQGRGIAYWYGRFNWSPDVFPNGIPTVTVEVKGKKWVDPRTGVESWTDNWAVVQSGWIKSSKWGVGAADAEFDATELNAEANACDEMVPVAADAYAGTSDGTTFTCASDSKRRPLIGDQFQIGGTDYYVASCVYTGSEYQVTFGSSLANARAGTATAITPGSITATRNGEPRYSANGIIDAGTPRRDTLDALRSAAQGSIINAGGLWRVLCAIWRAPTVTISEGSLRGPIRIKPLQSRRDTFNTVTGAFVDPSQAWQSVPIPTVTNATYVAADSDETIEQELNRPFTISPSMGQRLNKIALERTRREIEYIAPLKLEAFEIATLDAASVDFSRYGWSGKDFECQSWGFAQDRDGDGNPILGIDISFRELDSNAFVWSDDEEVPLPAASRTNLPSPWDVPTPTDLFLQSGTDQLLLGSDGTVISRIRAQWVEPANGFTDRIEIGWKKSADADWQTVIVPGEATAHIIGPVEDGVSYDVRLRAISTLGARSSYTTVTGHIVVGKTEAPSTPTGFAVTALADGTRRFSWTPVADADVRAGGGYRIRYHASSTTWANMTAVHEGLLTASPFESNELQAGTYNFALKAVDSSGNESANAAFLDDVVLPNPRLANALYGQDERQAGFPGTKTDCAVAGDGALVASSPISGLPATIADLDDTILTLGTPDADPIEYTTEVIDIGVDVTFTPVINVTGSGTATVTMKVGTNADGAPVGSFIPLARVTARYVLIDVSMPGGGTDPYIDGLQIILDAPAVTEVYEDLSTAASSTYLSRTAAGHFLVGSRGLIAAISTARIVAIQNVGPGFSWELISKSGTVGGKPAAEFKVYNSSNTLADATIDVELKGPKA